MDGDTAGDLKINLLCFYCDSNWELGTGLPCSPLWVHSKRPSRYPTFAQHPKSRGDVLLWHQGKPEVIWISWSKGGLSGGKHRTKDVAPDWPCAALAQKLGEVAI